MKKIKIISGTYGHRCGKRIEPKDRNSEPFELADDEAHRLVVLGVAKIVDTGVEPPENGKYTPPPTESPSDEADLHKMTNAALKEKAEGMGIDTAKLKTKKDLISAITEVEADISADEDDDPLPDISPEDPVL